MTTLRLHNSLTRRVEDFVPEDPRRVTLYVCGPTVYNYVHIGNARPYVVFGLLARLLRRLYPRCRLRAQHHRRRRQDQRRRAGRRRADRPHHRPLRRRVLRGHGRTRRRSARRDAARDAHIRQIVAMCERLIATRPRVRGRRPRAVRRVELSALRHAFGPLGRRDDRRRARRSGAVQEESRPISCCGNHRRRSFPAGTARGAADGPAGISSARRWPKRIWARPSTSTPAATT